MLNLALAAFAAFAAVAAPTPATPATTSPPSTSSAPALLRKPTMSQTSIAFSYGGDLWIVEKNGGDARRLTSDIGLETDPLFSPDGATIAFSGQYDGNVDVYTIAAGGGAVKRLTTHPLPDVAVGWSRDGKRIAFRSARAGISRYNMLHTVGVDGGLPDALPFPMGEELSFAPDNARIAYVPFSNFSGIFNKRGLKHYRGGTASPIWIAKLADSSVEKVPRTDSNDSTPMWIGDNVYFLSDRSGPVALWVYETATKKVRAQPLVVGTKGTDIKSASAGPDGSGSIVYEELGSIHVVDVATGKQRRVDIRVTGDFPAARPHFDPAAQQIESAAVSPTGQRAVFSAHGDIFTVPVEKGDVRNLTRSPGAADRDPAWSPDGKWIAWLTDDAGGEYHLMLRSQDGVSDSRSIDLGAKTFFYAPTWSPDSKKLAYSDKRLNLFVIDVTAAKPAPVLVDTTSFDWGPGNAFNPSWSPDSRFLAYAKQLPSLMRAVFVYALDTKKTQQVTDAMSDAEWPVFDPSGHALYFSASTDVGPLLATSMSAYRRPTSSSLYAIVLQKDRKSPLAPWSDEEKAKGPGAAATDDDECAPPKDDDAKGGAADKGGGGDKKGGKDEAPKPPKPVRIDFDNISQRVVALPLPARNWVQLTAGKAHVLFALEGLPFDDGSGNARKKVTRWDGCERKSEKLLDDVGGFVVTADGEKALYEQLKPLDPTAPPMDGPDHGAWTLKPVAALGKPSEPGKPDGTLKLDAMEVFVDPRAEWNQMFHEAVHLQRDFFYDANLHGADLTALTAQYQPFVDGVMSRQDLTYVIADMFGEITAQHIYLGGGSLPQAHGAGVGLLGCDFVVDAGRYKIKRIYRGENWNPQLRAPLTEPGVDVREGDTLLSVMGRDVKGSDEVYSYFQETAGKAVQLVVAGADGKKRTVTVVPIDDEGMLRRRAWMEDNKRKVDQLSGGKVAYVYLPNTAQDGYDNFNRYYFPQSDKLAAVIDERFNGGGWIADYVVDWLSRTRLMTAMTREGRDQDIPSTIYGPKVMLINQYAGSGGDALPWMFRKLGIGPLIGTRTWGGLIGIGGYPNLIDGGYVTAPRWGLYNPDNGEFDVENKGVAPDIEVDLDPALWRQGKDPQLERAVENVLARLKASPPPPAKRPKYPVYDWKKVRESASKARAERVAPPDNP